MRLIFASTLISLQIDVKLQALLTEHGLECAPPLTTARLLDKLVNHLSIPPWGDREGQREKNKKGGGEVSRNGGRWGRGMERGRTK